MCRKARMYYIDYGRQPRHLTAESVQRKGNAYVFRRNGEVVLHIDRKLVKTLRLLSDEEAKEIINRKPT